MDAGWRKRVKELFLAARERRPEERQVYLDEACGEDAELRHELESLLIEHDRQGGEARPPDSPPAAPEPADAPARDPLVGRTLGRYRILGVVGKGGMGTVYEAEDPELRRTVALKILPPAVARDPKRLERFKREARSVAALSHPNVVTLHSVEEEGEIHFLTMELVHGEPLDRLIPDHGLDLGEILDRATQLAEGLRAAHEQRIIHRDLKPANLIIDTEGRLRILDFGLAKAQPDRLNGTQAGTSIALTVEGTVLGTAPYMSPEQVEGRSLDARSDIFSFGSILYEMATGRWPFPGKTLGAITAAILRDEPTPLTRLRKDLPEGLQRIVDRCLAKEPAKRYQSARELRDALAAMQAAVRSASLPRATPPRYRGHQEEQYEPATGDRRPGLVAAVLAATAGVIGLWLGFRMAPELPPPEIRKVDLVLPGEFPIQFFQAPPQVAPDGSAVLFGAETGLYVRRLDSVENQLIPGTAGAMYSTWAPDSRQVAFVTVGRLWRTTLDGQSPVPIATLPEELTGGGGMVWTPDDRILLSGSPTTGLLEVSARGGAVSEAAPLDPETERDFHEVSLLPEGRGLLVSVHPQGGIASRIDVLSGGERRTVLDAEDVWVENPVYSPAGYVLFSKGSASAPALWAVPFSLDRLQATGDPFLVAPAGASPSVSEDGTLSYIRGRRAVLRQPLRLERDGRIERDLARPVPGGRYPAISPDGRRLVAAIIDAVTYDLVLFDIVTRTASRLTSGPGSDLAPAWSPDGRRIAYSVSDQDLIAVVVVDPPGEPRTLAEGSAPRWLPEGDSLLFQRLANGASWDIWRYGIGDGSETLLLDSPANERWPAPSPDGRWLAYTSDETGREELFVRGLPEGDKVQVSGRGATEPFWASPDELLFRSGTGIHTARRRPGVPLAFEQPELLLSLTDAGISSGEGLYAAGPDGTLVVFRDVIREDAAVLTLVTNWFLEFEDDR